MAKAGSASKIKMNSIDELFGNPGHPFKVLDDEKMEETVESIKADGVLVPGIVRARQEGGYEIISGHRRKRACEIAGLETMPVFVRSLTDDEASIAMVNSSIQREEILPSEKAKAYRMKYEAIKHQGASGKRPGRSLDELSSGSGESVKKIQRYLSLSNLIDSLLELLDEKRLGMTSGVELSFLKKEDQAALYEAMMELSVMPSVQQAAEIHMMSAREGFDLSEGRRILIGQEKPVKRNITICTERIRAYFPEDYSEKDMTEVIIMLLEKWRAGKEDV